MKAIWAALWLVTCASGCRSTNSAAARPGPHERREPVVELDRCSTLVECAAHDGDKVEVIGRYRKFAWPKGGVEYGQVQLVLTDDGWSPLLERYWSEESKRDPDEVSRFEGRRVAVIGRYLSETPPKPGEPEHAARLSIPAIVDIESIELAAGRRSSRPIER
jgi:hypothetical protein